MSLRLQIDSLALTGLIIPRSQRPQLQAALEAELTRLLEINGIPESLLRGDNIPKLQMNTTSAQIFKPTELGQAIARSIYADLNAEKAANDSSA